MSTSALLKVEKRVSSADLLAKNNIPVHNFSAAELLRIEKEILGVYARAHPLSLYREKLSEKLRSGQLLIRSHHIEGLRVGQTVFIAGLLIQVRRQFTKNREVMAFLLLEDELGLFEAIAFPEAFRKYFPLLRKESLLFIKGQTGAKDGEDKIIIQEMKELPSQLIETEQR